MAHTLNKDCFYKKLSFTTKKIACHVLHGEGEGGGGNHISKFCENMKLILRRFSEEWISMS